MFIGVTLTRRIRNKKKSYESTCSIVHEYHEININHGGPNRAIVLAAENAQKRFSSEWEVSCLQLSEYEYRQALAGIACEKMTIERMTGVQFEDRGVV